MAASKVAIVTGAGTGVGRAAALALMKAGYAVALAGRRKEPLEAVLKEGGGNGIAVPTDVTKVDAIRALFATVKQKYGRLDVLFGNAATPMTDRMVQGVMQPDGKMMPEPRMDAEHVGSAVAYMASLPLDANVLFMTVMATKMPFVGRG